MATRRLHIVTSEEYLPWATALIRVVNMALIAFGVIAIASLITQKGFYIQESTGRILNRVDFFVIQYYLLQFIIKLICSRKKMIFLKRHWFETILALLIVSEIAIIIRVVGFSVAKHFLFDVNVTAITEIYIGIAQAIIVLTLLSGAVRYNPQFVAMKFHPSQFMIISFAIVILCGAGLLMLPRATHPGQPISFIDALFTSASATCVTGLTVVDTATFFTTTGQIIIMSLIQIGGIGIMTFSCFLMLFFGKGIGVRERVVLREMLNVDTIGVIRSTLRNVILFTFGIEAAGAALLAYFWAGQHWPPGHLVYTSIFHSIAAFCNAGFSTFTDSLCSFAGNTGIVFTISVLIVLGGLGFVVLADLGEWFVSITRNGKHPFHFKVQTRMVITITFVLIIPGAILLYFVEKFTGADVTMLSSFFTTITARTAGFSVVDMSAFSIPAWCIIIFLMFIGGSPGSTGGGIKTTTAGVLFASIVAIITGQNRIILYRKRIPFLVLNRALVVFTFSVFTTALVIFGLSVTETADFMKITFEAVSAFATVGLSSGLSAEMSWAGKYIIVAAMFAGRVGLLTLVFAVTAQSEKMKNRVEYPSESLMVG